MFKGWWESVDQLFSLFLVIDNKGVEILGRSDLELGVVSVLLDGDSLGVFLAGKVKELLDILNFFLLNKVKNHSQYLFVFSVFTFVKNFGIDCETIAKYKF